MVKRGVLIKVRKVSRWTINPEGSRQVQQSASRQVVVDLRGLAHHVTDQEMRFVFRDLILDSLAQVKAAENPRFPKGDVSRPQLNAPCLQPLKVSN